MVKWSETPLALWLVGDHRARFRKKILKNDQITPAPNLKNHRRAEQNPFDVSRFLCWHPYYAYETKWLQPKIRADCWQPIAFVFWHIINHPQETPSKVIYLRHRCYSTTFVHKRTFNVPLFYLIRELTHICFCTDVSCSADLHRKSRRNEFRRLVY